MMSFRLFSHLEKGPILKGQIDKDLDFFFLLASTSGVTICLMFALKLKHAGKLTFSKECFVFSYKLLDMVLSFFIDSNS